MVANIFFHQLCDGKNTTYFIGMRGKGCKVSSFAVYSTVSFKIETTLEVPSIVALNTLMTHRKITRCCVI